jgi:hypothetical protein
MKAEMKRWGSWIRKKDVIMLSFSGYTKMNTCKRMECRTLKKNLKVDIHVKNTTKIGDKICLIQLENITDKDRDNEE